MGPPSPMSVELIRSAREGDAVALGRLLEERRASLRLVALQTLPRRLAARVDPSDVVQQSFLEAARHFEAFRGDSEPELAEWLRRIVQNKAAEAVRDHTRLQKRDVRREQSIEGAGGVTGLPLDVTAAHSSPSGRAVQREEESRLAAALATLPPDQRDAVRMRHLENRPLAEIAEALGRSRDATAGLIKRGVQALRERLARPGGP